MPEIPTYRVTGEDWDQPERDQPEQDRVELPATAHPIPGRPETPAVQPAKGQPPAGWATPVAGGAGFPPGAEETAGSKAANAARITRSWSAGLLNRLPPPIGPAMERVPPRLLLGGAGLVVAAVVIVMFATNQPSGAAATASTTPTEAAPAATATCPSPTVPLPIPALAVTPPGAEAIPLTGFVPPGATQDLDGPWPAALGSVDATVPLGSTIRLSSTGACIGEWRAVAARPPASSGEPWRPDAPETLQLGWQHADRVGWQPTIPLPPRGEWIVRLTVWYRDAAGATASTPGPVASDQASGEPEPAAGWVIERYFRIVVEGRGS